MGADAALPAGRPEMRIVVEPEPRATSPPPVADQGAWTPERVETLARLWDEGLSTTQIGRLIGMTKNAVVGKAHRLALPPRPSPVTIRPPAEPVMTKSEERRAVSPPAPEGRGCRWIDGLVPKWPAQPEFCGARKIAASVYCARHAERARGKEQAAA